MLKLITCGILIGCGTISQIANAQANITQVASESENVTLKTKGKVPVWLKGTLVRNGAVNVTINGRSNQHLFDGLSMLLSFTFENGKVTYSNQFLRSDAYDSVFNKNSVNYSGFAGDPCRSIFRRLQSFFFSSSKVPIQNANVNVAKLADEYVAMTEIPLPVRFDPKTLETLGVFDYEDTLPKKDCWESAHPHVASSQGEVINYLIEYGYQSTYTIYTMNQSSKTRNVIAKIPVDYPAYMHSFAVTENYIILTEFPLLVSPLKLATSSNAFIDNFKWDQEKGTRFLVINKETGVLEKTLKTKPFFAFHHVNAYEEENNIHMDIVTYENADILTKRTFEEQPGDKALKKAPTKLERFSCSLDDDEVKVHELFTKTIELPRINDSLDGKKYQFVYSLGFADTIEEREKKTINSNTLYKINLKSKKVLHWSEKYCSPGEPVFVASPNAKSEDDGVILSVVLNKRENESFLLVLDAKTFKEIARANMPCSIPTGLHGQFFR